MATTLHRAWLNTVWRIEQIVPTSTIVQKRFKALEPDDIETDVSDGMQRAFTVRWEGAGPDAGITDMFQREAEHTFDVTVVYPGKWRWRKLHECLMQDHHDLCKQLRDPDKWTGYDDSNPSATTGIQDRRRLDSRFEAVDEGGYLIRMRWALTMFEVE